MTIEKAQQMVYEIVRDFYGADHVFWAGAKVTRPPTPYVTIQFLDATRSRFPVKQMVGEDWMTYRDISCPVDINLYTKGAEVKGDGTDIAYGNTALSDLSHFADYIDSDAITEDMDEMTILTEQQPKDMSALLKESQYQYRAMMELRVNFKTETYGRYGMNNNTMPDSSGGGNEDMITDPYVIEGTDINGGYT